MKKLTPTVPCYFLSSERADHHPYYVFWCPFCDKWHLHGAGEGHRVAHCHSGPFKETGYILKCIGFFPSHLERKDGGMKKVSRLRLVSNEENGLPLG